MADLGTLLTDERMKRLAEQIEDTYRAAYKTAISNEQAWIEKLESLPEDTPPEQRQAFANEAVRRGTQAKSIAGEIANAGRTAANIIQGEMTGIYGLNYDWIAYTVNRRTGLALDWTMYDRNQIAVLVGEQQSPFTRIAYNNLGQDADIVRRLQNQLMQGIVNGESQWRLMQRIRTVTGQSTREAQRVAQTERTRVQSQGRQLGFNEAEAMGIGMKKRWISRMDSRVRDDHAAVTGEEVESDEPFSNGLMFPGDPDGAPWQTIGCRCVLQPMVKSTSSALSTHRERMRQNYGFEEWREERLANSTKLDIMASGSRNPAPKDVATPDTLRSAFGRLPNSLAAAPFKSKLQGYLLNTNHPVGKHKAKVINTVLGYHYENWNILSDKIYNAVQTAEVRKIVTTKHGTKYEIPVDITGEKNRTLTLRTVWQVDHGSTIPRLITTTFNKKNVR